MMKQSTNQRYVVEDPQNFLCRFKVTDSITNEVVDVNMCFVGKDMKHSTTWDYAPLFEMSDLQGGDFEQFRLKLHQDENYCKEQFIMNRRINMWEDEARGRGKQVSGLRCYSAWMRDIDGDFYITSDITKPRYMIPGKLTCKLFRNMPHPRIDSILYKLWNFNKQYARFNLSCEEIQLEKANKKSQELLKEWLSEDEYRWLNYQGQLEIEHEDEIYIVKKSPSSRVEVIDKDKKSSKYCMIAKDSKTADGDVLLSKILMIKTNPKLFKQIAVKG